MKPSLGSAEAAAPRGPKAGEVFDTRYRLVEELARGGMGRVFAAVDTKLGRKVAIKLIASPSPSATAYARFWHEARSLAQVSNPNVLTIYEAIEKGEHEGSEPYLVCELLEGSTLKEKATPPLPLSEVLDIAARIAHGLAAAHEQNIVHRDLKPDNVFITSDGQVKLIDFGIAKLLLVAPLDTVSEEATAETSPTPATAEGKVVGTAGYMAPEQIRGEQVDRRADVFSFGAVLYELVTSRRAFQGATAYATSMAILNDPPPAIARSVPSSVRRIIDRCLEKDPGRRFQSAEELQAGIDAARAILLRQTRRVRLRAVGIGIAIVSLLGGAVLLLRPKGPTAPGPRTVRIAPLQAAAAEAQVAAAIDLAFERALGAMQGMLRVQKLSAAGQTADWILRGSLSRAGPRLRLLAQFERADGQKLGEPIEAVATEEEIAKDTADLEASVRDQFMPLWRDQVRRERAHTLAHAGAAEEKLLAYYDLMGAAPRMEFLDRGHRLLNDAIAADPRYVPALAERSLLLRLASNRGGDNPVDDLRLSRADAEEALRIAPRDPQALLAECLTARLQMRNWPSDRELTAATTACADAAQADPQSVDALYSLAQLYDQACDDHSLLETLKLALDRAQRYDRRWLGRVKFYLVSVALQRRHLQEAETFSSLLLAEQAREDRHAKPTTAPLQGAHLLAAAVLLRLGRVDDAEREIETELARGATSIGGLDELIEVASLRGLARVAQLNHRALDPARAARLAFLEHRFAAADESDARLSPVVGWFGFMDPEAAVTWMEQHKTQPGCALAFPRAIIYRDAGHPDRAARALAACNASEEWARRCARVISAELSSPVSPSSPPSSRPPSSPSSSPTPSPRP
jgi:hypothetical protein